MAAGALWQEHKNPEMLFVAHGAHVYLAAKTLLAANCLATDDATVERLAHNVTESALAFVENYRASMN